MKVLLITPWQGPICGIQSHSEMLTHAAEAADPTIEITVGQPMTLDHPAGADYAVTYDRLDPRAYRWASVGAYYGLVHLNYHAGLHSRFTPQVIQEMRDAGCTVLVTYHDSGVPNTQQCLDLYAVAEAFVVHEPCEDLPKAIYWRMGVPIANNNSGRWHTHKQSRPILGSVGFDFGWKAFDRMAEVAAAAGWGLLLYVPEMTTARQAELQQKNPWVEVRIGETDTSTIIAGLRECDATAFLNVCHNAGQSGAILLGIAAGKPVIALETCRQYRALLNDELGNQVIQWHNSFEEVQTALRLMPTGRLDTGIVALAEQDSWRHLGAKYSQLYRDLVGA